MAIPAASCAGTDDPCCTWLFATANHLLASVFDALNACTPPDDCAGSIQAYVTLGDGDDGQTDALTVAVSELAPSTRNAPGAPSVWIAQYVVRLRESGWPTVTFDGDAIIMPTPADQAAAARYIYSRGEAMHAKLAAMMKAKALTPDGYQCVAATVGQMRPLRPEGGVVGWVIPVDIQFIPGQPPA